MLCLGRVIDHSIKPELAIKGFKTGNWWLIPPPPKKLKRAMVRETATDLLNLKCSSRWFSKLTLKFPQFWLQLSENNELSITLAQGCLSSVLSSLGPYNKGESSKCSSWLLFKGKETLEGVVVMPSWQYRIQTRHVTQISQRHRRERELQSFWKKKIC